MKLETVTLLIIVVLGVMTIYMDYCTHHDPPGNQIRQPNYTG